MNAQLQQFVNRIERLETEKKAITTDISEVYKEAKASGFDPKIMRKLIAKRKKPAAERQEEESLLDVYEVALGGVDNGPVTFTRKDGVKVTMERAGAEKPTVAAPSITEEFDAVTGEIADRVHAAQLHEHAGGADGSPSASPADPIELPHDPPEAPHVAVEAETGESPDINPDQAIGRDVVTEGGLMPVSATPPDDDLAIPDFMVRSKPPMHPAAQAEAFRA